MVAIAINRGQDLLEQQVAILTMIARDELFADTIAAIIALAERLERGSIAGVTLGGNCGPLRLS